MFQKPCLEGMSPTCARIDIPHPGRSCLGGVERESGLVPSASGCTGIAGSRAAGRTWPGACWRGDGVSCQPSSWGELTWLGSYGRLAGRCSCRLGETRRWGLCTRRCARASVDCTRIRYHRSTRGVVRCIESTCASGRAARRPRSSCVGSAEWRGDPPSVVACSQSRTVHVDYNDR